MSSAAVPSATHAGPWQEEVSALGSLLGQRLASPGSNDHGVSLWLGGAYSELMSLCGRCLAGEVRVADTQPRRLRACNPFLPEGAQMLRLLSLDDLRRDVAGTEAELSGTVLRDIDTYIALEEKLRHRFDSQPAIADASVDTFVMDFTFNRVSPAEAPRLLGEAFRVLTRTGRVYCAVMMADEALDGLHTIRDAPSGPALHVPTEQAVLAAFDKAGFHGLQLHWSRTEDPLVLDRIGEVDIRMCIVEAHKGKQGPCMELGQAVMYRGPWREVSDDDGHVYRRGERVAVCAKTYDLLMRAPYAGALIGLRSANEPPLSQAALFDCNTPALRSPQVTKGFAAFTGALQASACVPGEGCC